MNIENSKVIILDCQTKVLAYNFEQCTYVIQTESGEVMNYDIDEMMEVFDLDESEIDYIDENLDN